VMGSQCYRPPTLGCFVKKHTTRPKSPGEVALNDFEVLDVDAGRSLSKGSFGLVRRIRRKGTDDVYALKTMQKLEVIEGELIDQVEREIQWQGQLKHENVPRLYKHFEDADSVYLLLEYCANGELYQLLRTESSTWILQCLALTAMNLAARMFVASVAPRCQSNSHHFVLVQRYATVTAVAFLSAMLRSVG